MITVLVGPSGCGKSTLMDKLVNEFDFIPLPLITTRKKHINNGIEYKYVPKDTFACMVNSQYVRGVHSTFVEEEYDIVHYGFNSHDAYKCDENKNYVVTMGYKMLEQIIGIELNKCVIFDFRLSVQTLADRLESRGDDDVHEICRRLAADKINVNHDYKCPNIENWIMQGIMNNDTHCQNIFEYTVTDPYTSAYALAVAIAEAAKTWDSYIEKKVVNKELGIPVKDLTEYELIRHLNSQHIDPLYKLTEKQTYRTDIKMAVSCILEQSKNLDGTIQVNYKQSLINVFNKMINVSKLQREPLSNVDGCKPYYSDDNNTYYTKED